MFQSGGTPLGGGGPTQVHDVGPMLNTLFGAASPQGQGHPGSPGSNPGAPGAGPPNLLRQILMNVLGGHVVDGDGQFGDYAMTNEGEQFCRSITPAYPYHRLYAT